MAQNDVIQRYAAAIVTVGPGASGSPQRAGQELCLQRSIPVAFVEVRAEVVTLKVGEDIFHDERISTINV